MSFNENDRVVVQNYNKLRFLPNLFAFVLGVFLIFLVYLFYRNNSLNLNLTSKPEAKVINVINSSIGNPKSKIQNSFIQENFSSQSSKEFKYEDSTEFINSYKNLRLDYYTYYLSQECNLLSNKDNCKITIQNNKTLESKIIITNIKEFFPELDLKEYSIIFSQVQENLEEFNYLNLLIFKNTSSNYILMHTVKDKNKIQISEIDIKNPFYNIFN
jgi:hypothetical protein